MLRVRLEERDQLEVRAVRERDQRVVGADRMPAAGHDGEAEHAVARDRRIELGDDDDQVVDTVQHDARSSESRKRLDGTGIPRRCQATPGSRGPSRIAGTGELRHEMELLDGHVRQRENVATEVVT